MSDVPSIDSPLLAEITGTVVEDLVRETSLGEIQSMEELRDAAYRKYLSTQ